SLHYSLLRVRLFARTLLFFSLPPPPPTSTLFPYTTLFRSRLLDAELNRKNGRYIYRIKLLQPGGYVSRLLVDAYTAEILKARSRDRKSTRLNSSHVSISYAVFCLKKKRNKYKVYRQE